ncbi:3-dehydroquinate dehydratase, partial [Clostridioides difficile]
KKEEIVSRLCRMQELGADLPKIAVMPQNEKDVLVLLEATNEMFKIYADRPIITMSMSGMGVISRLCGEIFGSALTFGAAKSVSAPGQISFKELNSVLNLLHKSIN